MLCVNTDSKGERVYPPRALSCAQAAREAASRGTMLRLDAKLKRKSSRQVTRSMEGQERMQRSDSRSLGPGTQKEGRTGEGMEDVSSGCR